MEEALDSLLKYEYQHYQMPHLLKNTNYNFLKSEMRKVKLFHIKLDILIILSIFVHVCHWEYDDKGRLSAQKKMYMLLTHKILFYKTSHNSQDGIQLVQHTYNI